MVKHSKIYKQIKINFLTQNRRTSLDLPLSGWTLAAIFPPDCAQYHPSQPNQVQLFSECPSVLFWPLRTVNRMWGILTPFLMGPGWWGVQNFLKLAGVPPVKPGMLQRKKVQIISFLSSESDQIFHLGGFFSPGSDQRLEVGVNVHIVGAYGGPFKSGYLTNLQEDIFRHLRERSRVYLTNLIEKWQTVM